MLVTGGVPASGVAEPLVEAVALLAARSPKLRRALAAARKAGHAYLVIDGTLIPIDRVAADRPFYSGKDRRHGMNLQVIATPGGDIVWVFQAGVPFPAIRTVLRWQPVRSPRIVRRASS